MDQNTKTLNPINMNVAYQTPQSFFSPPGDQQSAYGSDFEVRASKKPRIAQHCLHFKQGHCSYGHNCEFSHTMRDAEKAPLMAKENTVNVRRNANTEHRLITEKGFCWKFCNGEECLDGERCPYRHENPLNLRSSFLTTRSVGHFTRNEVGQLQCRTPECIDVPGKSVYQRPMFDFPKARLCKNWEARSSCPYGVNCIFSHGFAEMQKVWANTERGRRNVSTGKMMSSAATLSSFCRMKSDDALKQQKPWEMFPFKCKSFEKLNGIYADWIDDMAGC